MGYLNNWYKSPAFFQDFAEHETAVCGAVRKNRVKFPKSFITEEFQLGKTISLKNGNLLALRLLDQKYTNYSLPKQEKQIVKEMPCKNRSL